MTYINNKKITEMIYEIRNRHVIFDSDLAKLYHCHDGTKTISLAVKRNISKFPEDFCFQITSEELASLKFSNEISNKNKKSSLPYVFTEEGVAMLATVLKTKVANEISINIMQAFVMMKKYISNELINQIYITRQVMKNSEDIKMLQETLKKFEEKKKVNEIYFKGQIYDAYSKILSIMQEAKKEIIIIDGYADKDILDMIRNIKVNITIICHGKGLLKKIDIDKYNKQYHNLKVIRDNSYHDRYIIIDEEIIYHCGASLNKIGYKTFSINLLEDQDIIDTIIAKVKKLMSEK